MSHRGVSSVDRIVAGMGSTNAHDAQRPQIAFGWCRLLTGLPAGLATRTERKTVMSTHLGRKSL